jgi:hypothetical protein
VETTSTVNPFSWQGLGESLSSLRTAYAMGGFEAVLRDYGAILIVVVLAIAALFLLLLVVFMPSKRKVVRKRVVRVTRHAVAPPSENAAVQSERGEEPPETAAGNPQARSAQLFKRWAVTVAATVVVLAGSAATYVVTGSNGYCGQSCHFDAPEVMTALENRHADCVDCHEDGPIVGGFARLRMALAYAQSEDTTAIVSAPVSPARCLRCHRDVARDTVTTSTGVRVSHAELLASGRACSDCHPEVGHRERRSFAGGMARCTVCHDGDAASTECSLCHPKGSPLETELTMDDPGSSFVYPTVQVANRDCARCHTDQEECIGCHNGFQLPHPTEFREGGHAPLAAFSRRERCYQCHTIYWCGDGRCHNAFTPHDPDRWLVEHQTGTSDTCGGCHKAWDYQGNWCEVCH